MIDCKRSAFVLNVISMRKCNRTFPFLPCYALRSHFGAVDGLPPMSCLDSPMRRCMSELRGPQHVALRLGAPHLCELGSCASNVNKGHEESSNSRCTKCDNHFRTSRDLQAASARYCVPLPSPDLVVANDLTPHFVLSPVAAAHHAILLLH